jgi:hypothetical protein
MTYWRHGLTPFFAFLIGASACVLLQIQGDISPILASASVGLIATFLPHHPLMKPWEWQGMFYTGSFAGMGSQLLLSHWWSIIILSIFGTAIFIFFRARFNGLGGKMGAIAFLSSLGLLSLGFFL